ncbi:MAG: hypothetical protein ACT4N5_05685 [Nitrosopumilaceae archaeon]
MSQTKFLSEDFPQREKMDTGNKLEGMGALFAEILSGHLSGIKEIHDIKIKTNSDLHKHLVSSGHSQDRTNKGIYLEIPTPEPSLAIKIAVYPSTIQIDIGCSNEPFTCDSTGALRLSSLLARIRDSLLELSARNARIPSTDEWIVTHRHYGIDGQEIELSGNALNVTVNDEIKGFRRMYTKILPDGRVIPRVEKVVTAKNTVSEELDQISNDKYDVIRPSGRLMAGGRSKIDSD